MPSRQALAGFFSDIFSTQAQADSTSNNQNTLILQPKGDNLQTIGLLQANVTSASVLSDDDKDKKTVGGTNDASNIVSDTSLLPSTGPLGPSDGSTAPDPANLETSVYVVRDGDTLAGIAKMFDVTPNTILWANDMKKGDKLKTGDVLFILPVSGVEHTVTKGQTIQGIAKKYNVDVNDILAYNDMKIDTPLAVGDTLIIPNGEKSDEGDKPITNPKDTAAKNAQYYKNHPVQNLAGYFIDPVPGYRLSQGIHDNNAVDLAISAGTPIHAAAEGTVILARMGYNGGFGNLVIIRHPNGTETLYAHQSRIAAHTGDQVYQGQIIGYVGSTGHSTGPHLHFEVHGARNPGSNNSWKY